MGAKTENTLCELRQQERSPKERRAFLREELAYNLTEDLLLILEKKEISKKELSEKMSKPRSYIDKLLSGSRNMTLGTLSEICFHLDIKPTILIPAEQVIAEANEGL